MARARHIGHRSGAARQVRHRTIALALLGVLTHCAAPNAAGRPTTGPPSAAQRASRQSLEQTAFALVNRHRGARGLAPLALDARISEVARRHSAAMARGEVPLGHDGFDERVRGLRHAIPARRTAENVAFNQGHREPASEAVRGWLTSRGHRENIEGPYELTGVGVAIGANGAVYFTQIFLGR